MNNIFKEPPKNYPSKQDAEDILDRMAEKRTNTRLTVEQKLAVKALYRMRLLAMAEADCYTIRKIAKKYKTHYNTIWNLVRRMGAEDDVPMNPLQILEEENERLKQQVAELNQQIFRDDLTKKQVTEAVNEALDQLQRRKR